MESEHLIEDIEQAEEEVIENEAEYWAGRVTDVMKQNDKEVDTVEALETLAVMDAEHNITDHYDPDEVDLFLDEFEEAIEEREEVQEVVDEHIKDAKKGDNDNNDQDKE